MYTAEFDKDWPNFFLDLSEDLKERTVKKIKTILQYPNKRHLHKSNFFVDEIGQFRIIYRIFEKDKKVRFYFVGTHKDYERWYKQLV